jgi:hypothetical protein
MANFLQLDTKVDVNVESFYAHRVWISESFRVCGTQSSNASLQSRNTTAYSQV